MPVKMLRKEKVHDDLYSWELQTCDLHCKIVPTVLSRRKLCHELPRNLLQGFLFERRLFSRLFRQCQNLYTEGHFLQAAVCKKKMQMYQTSRIVRELSGVSPISLFISKLFLY